jgi:hypothetical protein
MASGVMAITAVDRRTTLWAEFASDDEWTMKI